MATSAGEATAQPADDSYEVFISYSHDSDEHIQLVLELSDRLRSEGVNCVLDQYESSPPEGWPRWMDKKIRDAKYVLMVCTETYFRRVMGEEVPGTGLGVRWEGNLIYQHFYDSGSIGQKFVPVVRRRSEARFVPTPLKGATIYSLDSQKGYDELYARLAEMPLVRKPELGRKRPLPPRPVKTNPTLYVTGPIDVELWDRARWRATFFGEYPNGIPILGLAFEDEAAAREIFAGWHRRYGERDEEEELRIAIIEGDIPGRQPGYSVHISNDLNVFIRRLKQSGFDYDDDVIFAISRVHRMNPYAESTYLERFKKHVRYAKTYYLLPGVVHRDGTGLKTIPELGIFKSKVVFRHVSDIGEDDPDAAIFGGEDRFRED